MPDDVDTDAIARGSEVLLDELRFERVAAMAVVAALDLDVDGELDAIGSRSHDVNVRSATDTGGRRHDLDLAIDDQATLDQIGDEMVLDQLDQRRCMAERGAPRCSQLRSRAARARA